MFPRTVIGLLSRHSTAWRLPLVLLTTCLAWASLPAYAVPSFARQTGAACEDCHVGGFGPQLTSFGMKFKLEGYTLSGGSQHNIPISAMLQSSYQNEKTAPADGSAQHNYSLVQQASIFLGGRLTDHIGALMQATTTTMPGSAITDHFGMDNSDVRFVTPVNFGATSGVIGLSINNNPTVTDALNTVPAWRFNYINPTLTGVPASLMIASLGQQVWGANVYAYLNSSWYAEFGNYRSLSANTLYHTNNLSDPNGFYNKVDGNNPYWRVAYMNTDAGKFYSVGLFGLDAKLNPNGVDNKYRDLGMDATYQLLTQDNNIMALNAAYINEKQDYGDFDPTNPCASTSCNASNTLHRFDLNASYHFHQTYGVTAGYFNVGGSADANLYGTNLDGSPSAPNTSGFILQTDWTPFGKHGSWGAPNANLRLGLQYTWYTKYNGGSSYVTQDANGNNVTRNASDNNTLYAFVWTSF